MDSLSCFVTTLATRPDRLCKFSEHVRELKAHIQTFTAQPSVKGGKYGCWESHMATLLLAERQAPESPSVHFEDDAQPAQSADKVALIIQNTLQTIQTFDPLWRIIGLGGCSLAFSTGGESSTPLPGIDRVPFAETHAYIISPAFRRHILHNTSYEGHLDYFYAREANTHSYLLTPELFVQDPSAGSDNATLLNYVQWARPMFKRLQTSSIVAECRRPWRYHFGLIMLLFCLSWWLFSLCSFVAIILASCIFFVAHTRITDPYLHIERPHAYQEPALKVADRLLLSH